MFNGRDLHSGFGPTCFERGSTFPDDDLQSLGDAWDNAGEVGRCALVFYAGEVTAERSSAYSVTPATRFGNFGVQSSSEMRSRNFAQHGQWLLGSPLDASSRLAHEMAFEFLNGLSACGLRLGQANALNWLLSQVEYCTDTHNDQWSRVRQSRLDPFNPEDQIYIEEMKTYVEAKHRAHRSLCLNITKAVYYARRDLISSLNTLAAPVPPMALFRSIAPHPHPLPTITSSVPFLVTRVLNMKVPKGSDNVSTSNHLWNQLPY